MIFLHHYLFPIRVIGHSVTDGIYGFKIHLDIQGKGYPTKIEVTKSVRTVPLDLVFLP